VKNITLTTAVASKTDDHLIIIADADHIEQIAAHLQSSEMDFLRTAYAKEVRSFFFAKPSGCVFVRLLKTDKDANTAAEDARLAGAEALKEVLAYKLEQVTLKEYANASRILCFAEGMALAAFQFLKYIDQPEKKAHVLKTIHVAGVEAAQIEELNAIIDGVCHARRLVNEPFSFLTSPQLALEAQELGKKHGFSVEIMGKEKIEALKMGGLLAVNKASKVPPCFIVLEWIPIDPRNDQPVVLVGKGVVYDTGGYSIKPSEGMEYMKCDMGGAAAVLGTFVAAAQNKMPVHLVGLIPVTDNLVSADAIVPGDIIRMASGTTVEVMNTDAEGRLILADALHYAKKYKPELVIDFATLTGAAVRSFGSQAICYMGTASTQIKQTLESSGFRTYERLVEVPLWREYGEDLKSHTADMRNVGGPIAGAITAGKFLEHFTEGYPWLHLDIAGTAFLKTPSGYKTKEGTGAGVRLTYDFLKQQYLK
jgi:leucyl aminopeptidase